MCEPLHQCGACTVHTTYIFIGRMRYIQDCSVHYIWPVMSVTYLRACAHVHVMHMFGDRRCCCTGSAMPSFTSKLTNVNGSGGRRGIA